VRRLRVCYRIAADAYLKFLTDDGWAIASHIALSVLMSLFPFLILVTAVAGFFGTRELADEAAGILLEAWPAQVAEPIASEIHKVLTTTRGDVLTIGVLLAVYFASTGIESLRIGLNRAYGVAEVRGWWVLRLESIGYVLVAAASLLALAFLIVLAPLIFATAVRYLPWLAPLWPLINLLRFAVASVVLIVALVLVHKWLPAGRRRFWDIAPGILATLLLWLIAGELFGTYLAQFAYTYVTYYAGLASAMIALVFLYLTASIFIYGADLNAAILKRREERKKQRDEQAAQATPAPGG
jgi:membrane protein